MCQVFKIRKCCSMLLRSFFGEQQYCLSKCTGWIGVWGRPLLQYKNGWVVCYKMGQFSAHGKLKMCMYRPDGGKNWLAWVVLEQLQFVERMRVFKNLSSGVGLMGLIQGVTKPQLTGWLLLPNSQLLQCPYESAKISTNMNC